MYAKRFNELVIVTTAPYKRDTVDLGMDEWLTMRDVLTIDPFGSDDCSCDICNGQN